MSQNISGELTAIATAVLALFAFTTAILAGLAFWKQSREVSAIERQVNDQEELTRQQAALLKIQGRQLELQQKQFDQQADERRRAQASRVFIWTEHGSDPRATDDHTATEEPAPFGLIAHIRNTSEQPIYELTIDWGPEKPSSMEDERFPVLMPGDQKDLFQPWPDEIDPARDPWFLKLAPIARFRDAAGLRWGLTEDGQLDENPAEPYVEPFQIRPSAGQ